MDNLHNTETTESTQREYFMSLALAEAEAAMKQGDVPVGCVIVQEGKVLATGRNRREETQNPLAHAECEALQEASRLLGRWRLADCQLYVTLEPCAMCSGAIVNSKIEAIYYGASEEKTGCCGSVLNLFEEGLGHRPRIYGGILKEEAQALLRYFFQDKRETAQANHGEAFSPQEKAQDAQNQDQNQDQDMNRSTKQGNLPPSQGMTAEDIPDFSTDDSQPWWEVGDFPE